MSYKYTTFDLEKEYANRKSPLKEAGVGSIILHCHDDLKITFLRFIIDNPRKEKYYKPALFCIDFRNEKLQKVSLKTLDSKLRNSELLIP